MDEGEVNEEGEEVEGEEAEDGGVEEGEIEDGEADKEMEDKPPAADQFDLAKLFTEPMDFKVVSLIQHLEWLPKIVSHVSFYPCMDQC